MVCRIWLRFRRDHDIVRQSTMPRKAVILTDEQRKEKQNLKAKRRRDKNPEKSRADAKKSAAKQKAKDPAAYNKKKNDKRQALRRIRGVQPKGWNNLPPEEQKRRNRAAAIAWQLAHPEEYKESQRKSKAKNPKRVQAVHKAWCKRNPDKIRLYNQKAKHRRRMLLENQPDVDMVKWKETLILFDYKCLYCRAEARTLDHVVPVTRGGTNHHTNCVPACKRCNSSKGNKHLGHWLKSARIAKEALARPYDWEPPVEVATAA